MVTPFHTPSDGRRDGARILVTAALLASLALTGGCNSLMNGWLDPTVLGSFGATASMEIRTTLSLEDTPPGIAGATPPSPSDLDIIVEEYPITAGDTLTVEINELRERFVPYAAQVQVSATGYVNLPVLGRLEAAGKSVPALEDAIRQELRDREVILDPEVTINALFLQRATYSIFGIGVSAANDAPLRAGTFPIRRPDLRVLEAINQVGGLSEFVTDIYIFRDADRIEAPRMPLPTPADAPEPEEPEGAKRDPGNETDAGDAGANEGDSASSRRSSAQADLINVVEGDVADAPAEPAPADELEPNRSGPYMWINGEFVPNPTYRGADAASGPGAGSYRESAGGRQFASRTFDAVTPSVNWARIAGDTRYRVIRIDAKSLRDGHPDANIYVRAGDVIRIISGEIGIYYVMGQVNRVGPFAFNSEPITLKAAIAAAGGLSQLAWPDRCTIYRRFGQREQMIQINLDRIFAGKDADVMIRRGDIINVGTHPLAPYLVRLRDATLPNIAATLGYGFTYSRNFADIDSFAVQANPQNQPRQFPRLFP